MTTKELMLGDYITLVDCFNDGKETLIFKVVGLGYDGENSALVLLNGEKACDIVEIDDEWCGIPITQEILEKNGFAKNYMYNVLKIDEDFEFWYCPHLGYLRYEYRGELLFKSMGGLNYVHELQHALRLCGIDKEIEL